MTEPTPLHPDEVKLLQVIETCETEAHLLAAAELARLFIAKHDFGQEHLSEIFDKLKALRGE